MPVIRDFDPGFRVLKGWPEGQTLSMVFPIADGASFEYGDPVSLDADGKLVKANAATDAGFIGFAVDSTNAPNSAGIGKANVLISSFTAETQKYDKTQTYAVGDEITVVGGQITKYDPNAAPAQKPIGKVLAVDNTAGKLVFLFYGVGG